MPRGRLPPELYALGELGARDFKVLAAGTRSLTRETARLTLLMELFGAADPASCKLPGVAEQLG